MLKFTITANGVTTDYTRYVDWTSVSISEQSNVPVTMTADLYPADGGFQVPVLMGYVKIWSTKHNRSLYTGFIVSEPVRTYLAKTRPPDASRLPGQLFKYSLSCTSDDFLLSTKAIKYIPAFYNQSQGSILAGVAEVLAPGFFDTTTYVASGDLVPYQAYDPTQSWAQLAKALGDNSRHRFRVRDRQIQFQPFGDQPLGIVYDEETQTDGQFDPRSLTTTVLNVPIVNDITIVGDIEAGNIRADYFIGDGFTGNFPLLHKVFHGSSSLMLQESWNNPQLNTQSWYVQDPGDNFDYSAGALNIVNTATSDFDLGFSYLSLASIAVELAGGFDCQVGECIFEDYSEGMLGGLYTDDSYTAAALMGGFAITSPGPIVTTASGAIGVNIQPQWSGESLGPAVVTQANHSYVLQMVVTSPEYTRYQQTYRTADGQVFGGRSNAASGNVTFIVQDYDIGAATGVFYEPSTTQYTIAGVEFPPFAAMALVNQKRMNVSITNTTLTKMPQGSLTALQGPTGLYQPTGLILPMLPPGSGGFIGVVQPWNSPASANILYPPAPYSTVPTVCKLGNGFDLQQAQITQGAVTDTLAFYAQNLPAAGTPISFRSWEAQAAVSRLQNQALIAQASGVVGDDGLRSATITNLSPLPRTSEDCDNAALAYLNDRGKTFYNGTYTCTSLFFIGLDNDVQYWPTVGRYLPVNSPRRGIIKQKFLVTQLTTTVLDAVQEILQFAITFGADLYLQKVLLNFVDIQPPNVLFTTEQGEAPVPRFTQNVNNSYLPDLTNVQVDMNSLTTNNMIINILTDWSGPVEVRRLDTNWGLVQRNGNPTSDYIGTFYGPSFSLPRYQYDQVFYMRPVPPVNSVYAGQYPRVTSRRSAVIRVRWPLPPSEPLLVGVNGTVLQFNFNGDVRNIYGIELRYRRNDGAMIPLIQKPSPSYADMALDITQTPFTLDGLYNAASWTFLCYFFNQGWGYSNPTVVTMDNPTLGQTFRAVYT